MFVGLISQRFIFIFCLAPVIPVWLVLRGFLLSVQNATYVVVLSARVQLVSVAPHQNATCICALL